MTERSRPSRRDLTVRQERLLDALAEYVERSAEIGAMVVVGSFAGGTADAVSDLDLFFITYDENFQKAWDGRRDLHVTGAVVEWDELDTGGAPVAGHRWLTADMVLVESVISAPTGGGRLAEPFSVVAGDADLVENFPKRAPVQRAEISNAANHPVDATYDAFKKAVRATSRS